MSETTGIRSLDLPRALRYVAAIEAVSWLALIVATIVKYTQGSQVAVHILGPIHGVLFLAFVGLAIEVRKRLSWDTRTTLIVLLDSIIPGGGFVVARRADLGS
jgi:integral membrane protein